MRGSGGKRLSSKACGQLLGDPRDRKAHGIAIAMLGLAFVVAVAGMCWIVAARDSESLGGISQVWFLPAAVGGVFVGALIPFSTLKRDDPNLPDSPLICAREAIIGAVILAAGALAAGAVGATVDHLLALCVIGTVLGGVFFGLFIPSPGRGEP